MIYELVAMKKKFYLTREDLNKAVNNLASDSDKLVI